jgi:hypothetical protein
VELILMVLAPFPIGYFVRARIAAYLIYVALHSFVFVIQTASLILEWAGGDSSAFGAYPKGDALSYGLVNLVIYGLGLGLVTLGHWLRARRETRRGAPVDLAA